MATRLILTASFLASFGVATARADEPREVPKALLPLLGAAEKALDADRPDDAVKVLSTYEGAPDALHQLMLAHAHHRAQRSAQAEAAYRTASELDPTLRPAALGLARSLVDRGAWRDAADLLGKIVDVDKASALEIGLYAQVAFELRDLRLASLLVERGIIRHPADQRLRRLDVAILLERGATKEAYEAAWTYVLKNPTDNRAWRQLAAVTSDGDDPVMRLAALEAAALTNDADTRLIRSHAIAQFNAGHTQPALQQLKRLLKDDKADDATIELGVRIAEHASETELARGWLARVPTARRSEALHILEARLAIQSGEPDAARGALERLIASGEVTANVMLWAGQLAEDADDMARAEALYHQASEMKGPMGRVAVLQLARLLHRIEQPQRASELLASYLAEYPDDAPARTLLAVITRRN